MNPELPKDSVPPERVTLIDDVGSAQRTSQFQRDLAGSGIPELEMLAHWMDSVFQIPGSNLRFGVDAILGLIPGLGDTITTLVSLYILQAANQRGVPRVTMARMAMNTGVDYVVGSFPVLGDAFDVVWKSNKKNVEILRKHVEANPGQIRRQQAGDWLFFAALAGGLITLLVGSITITWFLLSWLGSLVFPAAVPVTP
jgi:hypothetical protein